MKLKSYICVTEEFTMNIDYKAIKAEQDAGDKDRVWCTNDEHNTMAQECVDNGITATALISHLSKGETVDAMWDGHKVSYRALYKAYKAISG